MDVVLAGSAQVDGRGLEQHVRHLGREVRSSLQQDCHRARDVWRRRARAAKGAIARAEVERHRARTRRAEIRLDQSRLEVRGGGVGIILILVRHRVGIVRHLHRHVVPSRRSATRRVVGVVLLSDGADRDHAARVAHLVLVGREPGRRAVARGRDVVGDRIRMLVHPLVSDRVGVEVTQGELVVGDAAPRRVVGFRVVPPLLRERHLDHVDVHVDRVVERLEDRAPLAAGRADRQEGRAGRDAGRGAGGSVAGNDARDRGAVIGEVAVHRIVVVVDEVPAADVVDLAVVVVVERVARHLVRVDPHVVDEVGMVVVDARVDHADEHAGAVVAGSPALRRAHLVDVPRNGRGQEAITRQGRRVGHLVERHLGVPGDAADLHEVGQRRDLLRGDIDRDAVDEPQRSDLTGEALGRERLEVLHQALLRALRDRLELRANERATTLERHRRQHRRAGRRKLLLLQVDQDRDELAGLRILEDRREVVIDQRLSVRGTRPRHPQDDDREEQAKETFQPMCRTAWTGAMHSFSSGTPGSSDRDAGAKRIAEKPQNPDAWKLFRA